MNNQVVSARSVGGVPTRTMIGQGGAGLLRPTTIDLRKRANEAFGKSAAGYVVSWQSRAIDAATGTHPQRHLFFIDKVQAERTADVKRKLGLKNVKVEARTVALKFSSLIPAS